MNTHTHILTHAYYYKNVSMHTRVSLQAEIVTKTNQTHVAGNNSPLNCRTLLVKNMKTLTNIFTTNSAYKLTYIHMTKERAFAVPIPLRLKFAHPPCKLLVFTHSSQAPKCCCIHIYYIRYIIISSYPYFP